MARAIPDAELVVLPATGHVPMEERPPASLEVVTAFLRGS
jgi:pimeloyl-ACP methyl ester carboxylesterase